MTRRLFIVGLLVFLGCVTARAEIEKVETPCEAGTCLYWWPRLPAVDGWHREPEPSRYFGASALAPDGSTFTEAETVIYAKALFKPMTPGIRTVEQLIANDRALFEKDIPGVEISEANSITTGDGRSLRSLTFFPAGPGSWERVSYGEEGDYFLLFTISSRSSEGYRKVLPVYEKMLRDYKEKL